MTFSIAGNTEDPKCSAYRREASELRQSEPETLFFVHIPKTAGSSFRHILKTWFGRELMIFDSHDRNVFAQAWNGHERPTRAVAGHFGFGLHEAVTSCRPRYVSLVRDTVERFVSLYKHVRETPDHVLHPAAGCDLEQFLVRTLEEPRARGHTVAVQCFFLTGRRSFEEALPLVQHAYDLVAPTGRLTDFVTELGDRLGRPTPVIPALNVRPADPELGEAADRLADRIYEAHGDDQRLYEHVSRCFADRASARPGVHSALAQQGLSVTSSTNAALARQRLAGLEASCSCASPRSGCG